MEILLWEIMRDRNLTIRQVSIMTGLSRSTVHRVECGAVSPTMDQMEQLAAGLKVRISDLYHSDFQ